MTAGEVLSQSEIDALLAALSAGEMSAEELKKEEEGRRVKTYDFRRALRFSKDQIRSLTRIHENFARLLTTFFFFPPSCAHMCKFRSHRPTKFHTKNLSAPSQK